MSVTWQWAKANPDAAARRIRELERENAELRKALDKAIVLLRRWNRNDVTDDVVIDTRKVICAVLKEAQP
ncbi:MAG TPA: hypothetical protein VIO63_05085 [Candidatus Nanopelagicaceae bacterium]|jgi:hypothetical protein